MKNRNRRAKRAHNSTGDLPLATPTPEPAGVPDTAPPAAGPQLILLRVTSCKTHPHNMRRIYPVLAVRQMAESIHGIGGLIQPLLVTDNGDGSYTVIDGNMRTAGGRLLGEACPLLKAEVVSQSAAQQYLTMAAANLIRYEIDAISEGLHYQRLRAEGLSMLEIAEQCGVYHARISHRLKLLEFEQPIQDLMAAGKLPIGLAPATALLAIPDPAARLKLCQRMAASEATAKAIEAAAIHLRERLEDPNSVVNKTRRAGQRPARPAGMLPPAALAPMLPMAEARTGLGTPDGRVEWPGLRSAAHAMCRLCDIKIETLKNRFDEPAWTLIAHNAGEVCNDCSVRDVAGACSGCPGVELVSRLLRAAHPKPQTAATTMTIPDTVQYERV